MTSAKIPLGSIATYTGAVNSTLPPSPSRKPRVPLPASVVVFPVAMSTWRMRLSTMSCDAPWEDTLNKS